MSSKRFMYLSSVEKDFYPYSSFQWTPTTVESQNYSSSAASKGYKRFQMMNKGLI